MVGWGGGIGGSSRRWESSTLAPIGGTERQTHDSSPKDAGGTGGTGDKGGVYPNSGKLESGSGES